MRRTSTCAWRLRPRVSWPWVASRRLSWATTRWTAARSCSGPVGSARSSSFSGRDGGSACVRSICARSSSRRRCGLEAADLVARQARLVLRAVLLHRPAGLRAQAERAADPLDVDAEHAGALAAAAERGDREPREVAHRGVVAVAIACSDLLAQRVEVDPLAAGDRRPRRRPRARSWRSASRLGGAEEEALEDEVEDAPVLGRLGERRGERLAEVAAARSTATSSSAANASRSSDVPIATPSARSASPEVAAIARVEPAHAGAAEAATPTRSATVSRSVRCLTMIDIVSRKTSRRRCRRRRAAAARAPSRSTRRSTAAS